MSCNYCGATHGPGNKNTLCPLASNYRGQPQDYTDDVIAVMRATIEAQRRTLTKIADAVHYDVESGQDYVAWEFGDLERLAGEVHAALRHHEKRGGT